MNFQITFICSWIFPSSIINHTPAEVKLLEGAVWYDILSSISESWGCKLLKFQRLLFTHSTFNRHNNNTSSNAWLHKNSLHFSFSHPVFFCWGCFRVLLQKKHASFSDTKKTNPQKVSPLEESKLRLDSSKRCRSTWEQHIQMRKKTSSISVFVMENCLIYKRTLWYSWKYTQSEGEKSASVFSGISWLKGRYLEWVNSWSFDEVWVKKSWKRYGGL